MGLHTLLEKKKGAIVKAWFELVANSYAPDAARFIKSTPDTFANPIGGNLKSGLAALFDHLLAGLERDAVRKDLDFIIRIRAIQDFTPSQATAFILALKHIVRDQLGPERSDQRSADELHAFESQIDALCLFGFDLYVACREKIYDLKTNVERDKIYKAFERAGLIDKDPK
jgi:hypothetical protein